MRNTVSHLYRRFGKLATVGAGAMLTSLAYTITTRVYPLTSYQFMTQTQARLLFWFFICIGVIGFIIIIVALFHKSQQTPGFSIDWVGGTRDSCWFRKDSRQREYLPEEEVTASSLILDSALVINTPRPILVESLELEIAGKLYPSDWPSQMVLQSMQTDICFDFPLDISRGSRKVRLKAIIDGHPYWFAEDIKELRKKFH